MGGPPSVGRDKELGRDTWGILDLFFYLTIYHHAARIHGTNGILKPTFSWCFSPRKLQHTRISHTPSNPPASPTMKEIPNFSPFGKGRLLGVCSSSVCWNDLWKMDGTYSWWLKSGKNCCQLKFGPFQSHFLGGFFSRFRRWLALGWLWMPSIVGFHGKYWNWQITIFSVIVGPWISGMKSEKVYVQHLSAREWRHRAIQFRRNIHISN